MTVSVDTLIHLAAERSHAKRHALLLAVTDMFFAVPDRNPAEMSLFDQVMHLVLAEVEPIARRELAERLADLDRAPRQTLLRLADDEIAVAEPVLKRARALADDDLEPICRAQTQAHLLAIAQRITLSERLTDILVARGNDLVAGAVTANEGARLSATGFARLADRASANDDLLNRLVMRRDLPERIATELLPVLAKTIQEKIEDLNAEIGERTTDKLIGDTWVVLAERLRAQARYARPVAVLVDLIDRGSLLFNEAVIEVADADQLVDLAALIGRRLGLPSETVVRNLFATSDQAAMLICRAAGLDLNAFSAVLRLLIRRRPGRPEHPDETLKAYLTIPRAVAESVLHAVHERNRLQ